MTQYQKIYENRKEQKEVKLSYCDFIQQWNNESPITVPELETLKAKREGEEFFKIYIYGESPPTF